MPNSSPHLDAIDLASVPDPDVRRALRQMHEQYMMILQRQQMEIEALLEMMIDKHIGSLGEFKRYLSKLQTGNRRTDRIHEEILNAAGFMPNRTVA
jgi:hypothetical protein